MLQRIISAAIAIPLFVLIVCFSPNWLFVLFCLACVLGVSYEFAKLQHFSPNKAWVFALGCLVFALLLFGIFPQHEHFMEYANKAEITEGLQAKITTHTNSYNRLLLVLGIIGFLIWFLFVPILLWRYARSQKYARHSFRVNPRGRFPR